jgi:hypothetical protein
MANPTSYKVITGKAADLETQMNALSQEGWKVVAAASNEVRKALVILEKAQDQK